MGDQDRGTFTRFRFFNAEEDFDAEVKVFLRKRGDPGYPPTSDATYPKVKKRSPVDATFSVDDVVGVKILVTMNGMTKDATVEAGDPNSQFVAEAASFATIVTGTPPVLEATVLATVAPVPH